MGDRILGDLAHDRLAVLQNLLDPGSTLRRVEVVLVEGDVAPVEDGVLGRPDVDEGRLHAGQHVLHLAEVDVAVDLGDVVRGTRHVELDESSSLEHRDLGGSVAYMDHHRVAADGLALTLPAPATLEGFFVQLDRLVGGHRPDRVGATATAAPTPATATPRASLTALGS